MRGDRDREARAWNGEIGPFLEEARQKRGLSLKEAERYTRIRSRYLEGLEREDPGELPDKSYVQGFLNSYAEFLGLDVEELGRKFKRYNRGRKTRGRQNHAPEDNYTEPATSTPSEATDPGRRDHGRGGLGRSALLTISLVVLALGLAIAAFYAFPGSVPLLSGSPLAGGNPPVEGAPGGNDAGSPSEAGSTAPSLKGAGGARGGPGGKESIRATVLVRGSESWISVQADSEVVYTGIAQPGFSRRFKAGKTLSIATGNAGALRLRLNGMNYGLLGNNGEVTYKEFTFKSER